MISSAIWVLGVVEPLFAPSCLTSMPTKGKFWANFCDSGAQLEKYDFLRSSVDVKGMAYETIVGPTLEGVKGEFFTPRNVVKMAVRMLDPNPGDRILDPACGTGGFIVVAFNYVTEKIRQAERKTWKDSSAPTAAEEKELFKRNHEAGKSIFGLDFNANLVKTAQMNMVMNNDGRGGLFCINSLLKPSAWPTVVQQVIELGSMDIVMTNPPFGTRSAFTSSGSVPSCIRFSASAGCEDLSASFGAESVSVPCGAEAGSAPCGNPGV